MFNCNAEGGVLMLKNRGHLYFNQMGELIILPITVHIHESAMENILYFEEVANIMGVHIKMETSKEKFINVHIQDRWIIHFKSCT